MFMWNLPLGPENERSSGSPSLKTNAILIGHAHLSYIDAVYICWRWEDLNRLSNRIQVKSAFVRAFHMTTK